MRRTGGVTVIVAVIGLATVPWAATGSASSGGSEPSADNTGVLAEHTMSGQPIPCAARPDGVRVCHGDIDGPDGADLRLESFDGTPLSVYVTLPPTPGSGGGYPLIVQSHGWGAVPKGPDDRQYGGPTAAEWASKGYAVLQLTARGWGSSCGTEASRLVDPDACQGGYIRLDDVRYEARDVQFGIGLLVDEGIADADRIGLTGESYGSGVSLEVATLGDRVMEADGSLTPWTSPDGTPLHVAAAVPAFGWTDLYYALMPNGRTLDTQVVSTTDVGSPPGIWKQSIGSGLFFVGDTSGYIAPLGVDPEADVRSWFATMGAGEPYGDDTAHIAELGSRYHSPYSLLAGAFGIEQQPPAPLLMVAGFTDTVFPVDETLRYYNLHRELYPDSPISLYLYDGGHQRAQNKPDDGALLVERIEAFFDHYVGGTGPEPVAGVTALSQTCPPETPSGGPFEAETWSALHTGEVRFDAEPSQAVRSDAGDDAIAQALDPVLGGLACTTVPAADQGDGVATYRLPAATDDGYTLLGAPTVTADLAVTGSGAYLAARLFDVDPETDTAVLVARGEYRIDPDAPEGVVTFQLHANAWRFAPGHIPKLELLGQDAPYLLASNGDFSVTVSNLSLQLPVYEAPGDPDPLPAEPSSTSVGGASPEPTDGTSTDVGNDGSTTTNTSDDSDTTAVVVVVVVLVAVAATIMALVARSARRRRATRAPDGGEPKV